MLCALGVSWSAPGAHAEVQLPGIFSDHAVLQCDRPIPIWGRAAGGEEVAVTVGERPALRTTAGAGGGWRLELPPCPAGGACRLVVKGRNELAIEDVLVGEVRRCSGQSNMEFTVDGVKNAEQEKAAATDGQIRQL
jgi:sialate O-acetylesterase